MSKPRKLYCQNPSCENEAAIIAHLETCSGKKRIPLCAACAWAFGRADLLLNMPWATKTEWEPHLVTEWGKAEPLRKGRKQHVFGEHTQACIHCGISAEVDAIAGRPCPGK